MFHTGHRIEPMSACSLFDGYLTDFAKTTRYRVKEGKNSQMLWFWLFDGYLTQCP